MAWQRRVDRRGATVLEHQRCDRDGHGNFIVVVFGGLFIHLSRCCALCLVIVSAVVLESP